MNDMRTNTPISPWRDHAEKAGPYEKYMAIIQNRLEVAMGWNEGSIGHSQLNGYVNLTFY
jgi:hypothetical protein